MFPPNSLAKEIFDEQLDSNWPGLISEAMDRAKKMGISVLLNENVNKRQFKQIVKKKSLNFNDYLIHEHLETKKVGQTKS